MPVHVVRIAFEIEPDRGIVDLKRIAKDGAIVEFVVQYRIFEGNRWRPVVRYDNCHGEPHVHRFWRGGHARRLGSSSSPGSVAAALIWAESDLMANWKRYRRLMIGKIRQQSYHVQASMED